MTINKYKASPVSNNDILTLTKKFRKIFGIKENDYVDIVRIMEYSFPFAIRTEKEDDKLQDILAYTDHDNKIIIIREDAYVNAIEGQGRDRFTIAHEVAHFILHGSNGLILGRTFSGEKIKTYEDPEWQADAFAGELLCPTAATKGIDVMEITKKFGVSIDCANTQKKKGERK